MMRLYEIENATLKKEYRLSPKAESWYTAQHESTHEKYTSQEAP